jgi:hypothetical protein
MSNTNEPARGHDPAEADDPTAAAMSAAGRRLRRHAPDEVAARQALTTFEQRRDEVPEPPRRSWWPTLIGAGLATAAIVGVVAIRSNNTNTISTTPATAPTVTPEPPTDPDTTQPDASTTPATTTHDRGPVGGVVIDDGCITVSTAAGSATGCPDDSDLDHLDQRTFVADLDGPVIITSDSGDLISGLRAIADDGSFTSRCQWDDLASRIEEGGLVEVVVCNDDGVMGATTARVDERDRSATYFTLPGPYLPGGADLGRGSTVDGMPGARAFTAAMPAPVTCSLLLVPDRSRWNEVCDLTDGDPRPAALVQIGSDSPTLYEIRIDGTGLITSAQLLDSMAPSSGCSLASASDLIAAVPAASIVSSIGCIGDKAALITGSVLAQQGPPDGSIWEAVRENGVWAITDSGTGIEGNLAFPIVPFATWSQWPESTVPGFRSYLWEPIVTIDAQPTVEAFASDVLATLATLDNEPEFPLNERITAVRPDGLPLLVAQIDLGGDDSVAGAVIFVWLDELFDDSGPIGWRAGEVLSGEVCARGETGGQDLCV